MAVVPYRLRTQVIKSAYQFANPITAIAGNRLYRLGRFAQGDEP